MTAVMTVMTTATAAAGIASAAAAAAAATTSASAGATAAPMTGQDLAIAPDEGDTNHREKDRDAKQQSTIHPKSSNKNKQVPYLKTTRAVLRCNPLLTAAKGEGPIVLRCFCSQPIALLLTTVSVG
jgi:hypothetical protein